MPSSNITKITRPCKVGDSVQKILFNQYYNMNTESSNFVSPSLTFQDGSNIRIVPMEGGLVATGTKEGTKIIYDLVKKQWKCDCIEYSSPKKISSITGDYLFFMEGKPEKLDNTATLEETVKNLEITEEYMKNKLDEIKTISKNIFSEL